MYKRQYYWRVGMEACTGYLVDVIYVPYAKMMVGPGRRRRSPEHASPPVLESRERTAFGHQDVWRALAKRSAWQWVSRWHTRVAHLGSCSAL